MNILITGASGFIGRHLVRRLLRGGHTLRLCAHRRQPDMSDPHIEIIPCDFTADHDPAVWKNRLDGVDVVINAVGIIRERGRQTFDSLHTRTPVALFQACLDAGVQRVIQVSALGADEDAAAQYHLSKKRADDVLRELPLEWAILQPSLIYGEDGESAKWFRMLARLPLQVLPGGGGQQVQPVHIDDLTELVSRLVTAQQMTSQTIIVAGPEAMPLKDYLAQLRRGLGLKKAPSLSVPVGVMRLLARLGDRWSSQPLCSETWGMLQRGNRGETETFRNLLGRALTPVASFIPARDAAPLRQEAALGWLTPLAAYSLALLWLYSGLISLSPWAMDESLRLLAFVGLEGGSAGFALVAASGLDIGLGLAIVYNRQMRWLWELQIAVVCVYTLIIATLIPEFLLHPYTPIVKNIPLIFMMALLAVLERR